MSDSQPPAPETPAPESPVIETPPVLRREALLPNERSRGLGTVAVVCTMAGVASGLALATTLMAMQVADTMSARSCGYHVSATPVELKTDHGFLGIRYVFHDGVAEVDSVLPTTPAEAIGIQPGDHVLSVDGDRIDSGAELQELIYDMHPGSRPTVLIERAGTTHALRPTLISWPTAPTVAPVY
jgi:S1-C subfamily serine protease